MKSLTNVFKRKPKPKPKPNDRSASAKKGWETRRRNQNASKRTEQGYADFRNQAREASRKNARRRGG